MTRDKINLIVRLATMDYSEEETVCFGSIDEIRHDEDVSHDNMLSAEELEKAIIFAYELGMNDSKENLEKD